MGIANPGGAGSQEMEGFCGENLGRVGTQLGRHLSRKCVHIFWLLFGGVHKRDRLRSLTNIYLASTSSSSRPCELTN
jgi:hypothetical protein